MDRPEWVLLGITKLFKEVNSDYKEKSNIYNGLKEIKQGPEQAICIQISVWKVGRQVHVTRSLTLIFRKGRGSGLSFQGSTDTEAVSLEIAYLFQISLPPKT